jgi:YD repeat-containing protein
LAIEYSPARVDAPKLRTSYEFNTDGTLNQTTDPKGLITRYEYDALGRRTVAEIANYVDGTPGGGANDDEDVTDRRTFRLPTSVASNLVAQCDVAEPSNSPPDHGDSRRSVARAVQVAAETGELE